MSEKLKPEGSPTGRLSETGPVLWIPRRDGRIDRMLEKDGRLVPADRDRPVPVDPTTFIPASALGIDLSALERPLLSADLRFPKPGNAPQGGNADSGAKD